MKEQALRLALDAFGEIAWSNETQWQRDRAKEAIITIKQALEQERALQALHDENERLGLYKDAYGQPEPVIDKSAAIRIATSLGWTPKREWQGLTNEEFADILCDDRWQNRPELMMLQVQAKLKEKNHDPR